MGQVATDLGDERGHSGRVELHLEERGPGGVGIILVTIRYAWPTHKTRVRVAERHGEPERDKVLERLRGGQRAFPRQSDFPLQFVAGVRRRRNEADTGLVVSYVMTVVKAARAVLTTEVSTNVQRSERLLNFAVAVAIQAADGIERLSRRGW